MQVECCEITDPYMNTDRNKNCISIVIKRADYETKTPDYPGFDDESKTNILFSSLQNSLSFPESDDIFNV